MLQVGTDAPETSTAGTCHGNLENRDPLRLMGSASLLPFHSSVQHTCYWRRQMTEVHGGRGPVQGTGDRGYKTGDEVAQDVVSIG